MEQFNECKSLKTIVLPLSIKASKYVPINEMNKAQRQWCESNKLTHTMPDNVASSLYLFPSYAIVPPELINEFNLLAQ